jgi:hypothetical protein
LPALGKCVQYRLEQYFESVGHFLEVTEMKTILALATLAVLGFAGAANAATVGVTLGSASNTESFGAGSMLSPSINLATAGSLSLSNATIVNPTSTVANQYIAPTGSIYQNNYLAVFGGGGLATYTLSPNQNTFSFTWGTIDDFNTLTVTDSRNVSYTITGSTILANIGGSVNHTTQSDVSISDAFGAITKVQFGSSQNSFEVANFGSSAAPLPAALPLFGAAFLALVMFGRRARARA